MSASFNKKNMFFLGSKSWIFRGAVRYVEYEPLEAEGLGFATDVCGLFCPQISFSLGVKELGKNDSHFEVSIYGVSNGLVQPPSRIVVVFFRWD